MNSEEEISHHQPNKSSSLKRTMSQTLRNGRAKVDAVIQVLCRRPNRPKKTVQHHLIIKSLATSKKHLADDFLSNISQMSPSHQNKEPSSFSTQHHHSSSSQLSTSTTTATPTHTSRPSTPSPSSLYASSDSTFNSLNHHHPPPPTLSNHHLNPLSSSSSSPKKPLPTRNLSYSDNPILLQTTITTTKQSNQLDDTRATKTTTTTTTRDKAPPDFITQLRSHQIEWSAMNEIEKMVDPDGTNLRGMTARQIRRLIQQKRSQTWLTVTDGPLYEIDEQFHHSLGRHSGSDDSDDDSDIDRDIDHDDDDDDDITRHGSNHSSLTHYHQALEPSEDDDWSQCF